MHFMCAKRKLRFIYENFLSKLVKENEKQLICGLFGDGDKGGFDIIHLWKCGSFGRYPYMNKYLTIPKIYHVVIRGFHLRTSNHDLDDDTRESFVKYLNLMNQFPENNRRIIDNNFFFKNFFYSQRSLIANISSFGK